MSSTNKADRLSWWHSHSNAHLWFVNDNPPADINSSPVMRGTVMIGMAVRRLGIWMYYEHHPFATSKHEPFPTCAAATLDLLKQSVIAHYNQK